MGGALSWLYVLHIFPGFCGAAHDMRYFAVEHPDIPVSAFQYRLVLRMCYANAGEAHHQTIRHTRFQHIRGYIPQQSLDRFQEETSRMCQRVPHLR